jgi:hypothetical protein
MTLLGSGEFETLEQSMEKTADQIFFGSGLNRIDGAFCDPEVICGTETSVFFRIRFGVSPHCQRSEQTALYVFDRTYLTSTAVFGPVPTVRGGVQCAGRHTKIERGPQCLQRSAIRCAIRFH